MRRNYSVGDWFCAPLRTSGFGLGVVARMSKGTVLLGYFFPMWFSSPPVLEEIENLSARDAVLIQRFGYLGIKRGDWPLLGRSEGWNPAEWPMPIFSRYQELDDSWMLIRYADDDPLLSLAQWKVPEADGRNHPDEALAGAGAMEGILTRLIKPTL